MPPLRLCQKIRVKTMKEKLIRQIENHIPCNAQEAADKALMLQLLSAGDPSTRNNLHAHLTVSAWVVSPDRKKVLMAYHNLYNSWAWLGGHADGNWNLEEVAEKEAREESGIQTLQLLSDAPISLEILNVSGHEKKGAYVSSHLHLNLTYLFEGDPAESLRVKPDENSRVGWIAVSEIAEKSTEPWFVERIYSKLVKKVSDEFPPQEVDA